MSATLTDLFGADPPGSTQSHGMTAYELAEFVQANHQAHYPGALVSVEHKAPTSSVVHFGDNGPALCLTGNPDTQFVAFFLISEGHPVRSDSLIAAALALGRIAAETSR